MSLERLISGEPYPPISKFGCSFGNFLKQGATNGKEEIGR